MTLIRRTPVKLSLIDVLRRKFLTTCTFEGTRGKKLSSMTLIRRAPVKLSLIDVLRRKFLTTCTFEGTRGKNFQA